MGRLNEFKAYLDDRQRVVADIEARLCDVQAKYEVFFGEVTKAREAEIEQLVAFATGPRSELPEALAAELDAARAAVERDFDELLAKVEKQRAELAAEAEALRAASAADEAELRRANAELDAEEEALKVRSSRLLEDIASYNARIRELATGFGFFANFFRMRKLQAERVKLDTEQGDVAARIEALRKRWEEASHHHTVKEQGRQLKWTKLETEAAAAAVKGEALGAARPQMVVRSAVERVLESRRTELSAAGGGKPCPRCSVVNPVGAHFCHICAKRLTPDRPDLAGSIEEVAELNHHHARFSAGMKACQEIIALVRGIASGLEAFTKSVVDMIKSEKKHSLAKLEIDVPEVCREWGTDFERFRDLVTVEQSVHPTEFAATVESVVAHVFTEPAIKSYFETMGAELTAQADRQWK